MDAVHAPSRPLIMGILNITPDSFFDGNRTLSATGIIEQDALLRLVETMVEQGADCLDIGAESSRPGSTYIEEQEELDRLLPVIELVRSCTDLPLSVDTRKSRVAELALSHGANIINDISACRDDPEMADVAARHDCPIIIMHMRGTPETMQISPEYEDCVTEVCDFLDQRARYLISKGVASNNILLDPGFGFGKADSHNLQLIRQLTRLCALGYPVVMGHSRKGTIGRLLMTGQNLRPVDDRLNGTVALTALAVLEGARVVRVHDVQANRDALLMADAVRRAA